jgi:hypothetical protein
MTTYSGTLIYTLNPTPNTGILSYPIVNSDNAFTTLNVSSNDSSNITTVSIEFVFVDNGTTNDGFSFNIANSSYNIMGSTITITQFAGIPLSRNSAQFAGLTVPLVFSVSDSPTVLIGTSLGYAFAGSTQFNSNINFINTTNATSMTGMFIESTSFNNGGTTLLLRTDNCTDFSGMFYSATSFNQTILSGDGPCWNSSNGINMSYMFYGASSYNNGGQPLQIYTDSATSMNNMFNLATSFNQTIQSTGGYWNTHSVSNFSSMFYQASDYNNGGQPLELYTNSATTMETMFQNANSFNQPIRVINGYWNTSNCTNMYNMFYGAGSYNNGGEKLNIDISHAYYNGGMAYTLIPDGFSSGAPLSFELSPFYNPPCFKEGTLILTKDGYRPIEELKKGDLIKTTFDYKPVYAIGKGEITHSSLPLRIKNQLYEYSTSSSDIPSLMENLILTGCHCLLVDQFKNDEEKEATQAVHNGKIYITDNKYRLPACVDKRSSVYSVPGTFTIYHIALEHLDSRMNYGIYANGVLVETCSKRYLLEYSGLELV